MCIRDRSGSLYGSSGVGIPPDGTRHASRATRAPRGRGGGASTRGGACVEASFARVPRAMKLRPSAPRAGAKRPACAFRALRCSAHRHPARERSDPRERPAEAKRPRERRRDPPQHRDVAAPRRTVEAEEHAEARPEGASTRAQREVASPTRESSASARSKRSSARNARALEASTQAVCWSGAPPPRLRGARVAREA